MRDLTLLGIRLPVCPDDSVRVGLGLADADGNVFAVILPAESPTVTRDRAEALAARINVAVTPRVPRIPVDADFVSPASAA